MHNPGTAHPSYFDYADDLFAHAVSRHIMQWRRAIIPVGVAFTHA